MQLSKNIAQVAYNNDQYPSSLRHISGPPAKLYILGAIPDRPCVAIVGSRRPTAYGKQITYIIAGELAAAGVCIVSGLAIGIDGIAHQAALDNGGSTIAVLGSGINLLYPPRNRGLAQKIIASGRGAVISEFEPNQPALPHHFPQRNRIIAGLSLGVVITEGNVDGGSMITAGLARDFNRQVMAVPGNATNLRAAGPHKLLREGAALVTSAEDILNELNLKENALPAPPPTPANAREAILLTLLADGYSTGRELIEHSQLGAAEFARTMSLMEISGKVHNLGAGVWVRRRN